MTPDTLPELMPDAWIAVSRAALRHNFEAIRGLAGLDVQTITVVKANAFGHGAVEAARVFVEAGADFFAVTTPAEALELREAGIEGRILVFLPLLPGQGAAVSEANLDLTVCDAADLKEVATAGKPLSVHLKVDTGMGRLGVLPGDALALARQIMETPGVTLAGVYTHFGRALETDAAHTQAQFAVFQRVLGELTAAGIDPGLRHCANSAALFRFPEMKLDAVRPGTVLYGQYPSAAVPRSVTFEETWRMQARIVSLRQVPAGTPIGYGSEFLTRRASTLAVIPIGYADGFSVSPASAAKGLRGLKAWLRPAPLTLTVRGRRVPVLGRVAMQICTVDVTDVPGVAVGDVVTVPARRLLASARLPRVYAEALPEDGA